MHTVCRYLFFFILSPCIFHNIYGQAVPECSLITDNFSGQITDSRCAPVNMTMEVEYRFALQVDPSKVEILFRWNDGTGAETRVPATSSGNVLFSATETHYYPPSDECSYTAEAFVICDGEICESSSRQEQTFSVWSEDNENGGKLLASPKEGLFCEGEEIVDFTFRDRSTFNCNINIEPDKPNRITRWVQFIYGTNENGGDRIPNVSVEDDGGAVTQMTDASGSSLGTLTGPIVTVPMPADGPNQVSWKISAPAGGVAGDIFEVTMRNWNICNPYDNDPYDGVPPADPVNGDNPPIITTSVIKIITTPPELSDPSSLYCINDPVVISTSGGNNVKWYADISLTNLLHEGSSFDPTGSPTFIDNSVPGNYNYYVTDAIGICESAPVEVSVEIVDEPSPVNAGDDQNLCTSSTTLNADVPLLGTGAWSTTGGALIGDPANPTTTVTNLDVGENVFIWEVINGPCSLSDEVKIYYDLQPDPADAGPDIGICDKDSAFLNAVVPNNDGYGIWNNIQGSGVIADTSNHHSLVHDLSKGENIYVWEVRSANEGCSNTYDTVVILKDVSPNLAYAGEDIEQCDIYDAELNGNNVNNGGTGSWSVLQGAGIVAQPDDSITAVNNMSVGENIFEWRIISEYGICPESLDSVKINVFEMPLPANAGPDQELCDVLNTMPLGADPPSVGTGEWSVYTNPTGVEPSFLPDAHDENAIMQISAGNEGYYELVWTIRNGTCITRDTMSVEFGKSLPPVNAGPDQEICGLSTQLEASDPGIGNPVWAKISGKGDIYFFPDNQSPDALVSIDPGMEGKYLLEWRITSGSCAVLPANVDTVEIYFKPQPEIPVANDNERCGPGPINIASQKAYNATTTRWYDSFTGGNLIVEDTILNLDTLQYTTSFFISGYNDTAMCESTRERVRGIIHEIPDVPVATDIRNCGPDTFRITSLVGEGGVINRWYSSETGGKMIAGSNTYTTPMLSSSRAYWISSYNDSTGCESDRFELNITIDSIPKLPISSDEAICGPGTLTLSSQPGDYANINRWWDSDTSTNLLSTSLNYYTDFLDSTNSYWLSSYNDTTGCESERIKVNAVIHHIPDTPLVENISVCGPDSVVIPGVPGKYATNVRWYDMPGGTDVISNMNHFQTPYLTTTKNYWISSYNQMTKCESPRIDVKVEIKSIPQTTPIQGTDVVGINQTNVVYSVDYHTGSNYDWNVESGVDVILENDNFIILKFPNTGMYKLSVQETGANGCIGPVMEKDINVIQNLVVLDMNTKDTVMCEGQVLKIMVSPTGGTPSYSVEWSGDTQFLSADNVTNPDFNATLPGIYKLYVDITDVNLNKARDSIRVQVYESPQISITNKDQLVCAGQSLDIETDIEGGSGVYDLVYWSGNTLGLSSVLLENPVFNTDIRGVYEMYVNVIDDRSCSNADTVIITNVLPESVFETDAEPSCSPAIFNFFNKSKDAVKYQWDFKDGSFADKADVTHEFRNLTTSIGYFDVELTVYDTNNCSHASSQTVTVFPNPDHSFKVYPDSSCDPVPAVLTSNPGGFLYSWDFGDGEKEIAGYNVMHEYKNHSSKSVKYDIRLIATSFFGCVDTFTNSIVVHPSPKPDFIASPETQMFPDTSVFIRNMNISEEWDYFWNFGDGHTTSDPDPRWHYYSYPGNYEIKLRMEGEYCIDSMARRITILPHPPVANFKPVEPGCVPHTIQFQNSSEYADTYYWEFGDGAVSNKPNPVYTYYEAGDYKIKLTARSKTGKEDVKTDIGNVFILPNAFFDLAPKIVFVEDEEVHFFNLSDHGDIFEWDFGDGNTSTVKDPKHLYTEPGQYDVTLKVWTYNDCFDLYVKENAVIVEEAGEIVFPNVIKPLSLIDQNRTFKPAVIDQVEEYHLMIFNRWGELIFESKDQDMGWDGYYNGKPAKQDVYVWKLTGKYSNGKAINESGDVTVIY